MLSTDSLHCVFTAQEVALLLDSIQENYKYYESYRFKDLKQSLKEQAKQMQKELVKLWNSIRKKYGEDSLSEEAFRALHGLT